MNPQEIQELNVWIDVNLFDGGKFVGLKKRGLWYRPNACGYTDSEETAGRYTREEAKRHEYLRDEPVTIHEFSPRNYAGDKAAALSVLELCQNARCLCIHKTNITSLGDEGQNPIAITDAPTLELAICQFAKKLFTT